MASCTDHYILFAQLLKCCLSSKYKGNSKSAAPQNMWFHTNSNWYGKAEVKDHASKVDQRTHWIRNKCKTRQDWESVSCWITLHLLEIITYTNHPEHCTSFNVNTPQAAYKSWLSQAGPQHVDAKSNSKIRNGLPGAGLLFLTRALS